MSLLLLLLACVDVDADGNEEDGDKAEVDDGVDEDGYSTRLEVVELHNSALPWQLKKKTRGQ